MIAFFQESNQFRIAIQQSGLELFMSVVRLTGVHLVVFLGRERANLGALYAYSFRFVLVWFCLLPLHVWDGLRFVTVALPGLFSYFFSFAPGIQWCCLTTYRSPNV